MDRSRRGGTKQPESSPPAASRLTVRARRKNRKRPGSVWSRLPRPAAVADACGRALRRSLPVVAATSIVTLVGGGAYAGYRFVTTSERFAIHEIRIEGESHLTEDQIRAAISVRPGDNVFATNLDRVTRELRATPWIASASVHRELPDTLVIDIREHAPAALVELGGLYLVDTSGHPFKRAQVEAGDGEGLPVITGIARADYEQDPNATARVVTQALAALAVWRTDPARPAVGEIHVDAHRQLTLRTYEHAVAVELGPLTAGTAVLATRLHTFDAVWGELGEPDRQRARAIHLDARPDYVTVALAKE